jgi:acetoin utilization deacetylase AcuC-like enzyme
MSTMIIQHDDCLRHSPGVKHPESAQRVKAVLSGLEEIRGLQRLPAPRATTEQIVRVHPAEPHPPDRELGLAVQRMVAATVG